MAACRAVMLGNYTAIPKDANNFYWLIDFVCMKLDGSGEFFDINTKTEVASGDNAAQTMSKIVDKVVAGVVFHGDTIARTAVYLVDFARGS